MHHEAMHSGGGIAIGIPVQALPQWVEARVHGDTGDDDVLLAQDIQRFRCDVLQDGLMARIDFIPLLDTSGSHRNHAVPRERLQGGDVLQGSRSNDEG